MNGRVRACLFALLQPLPLTLGAIGYGAAILVKELPFFAPYAASWYWLLILTGFCQSMLAWYERFQEMDGAVVDPLLDGMTRLRGKIAGRIEKIPTQAMRIEIPELVNQLDQEVLPRLQLLVVRHHELEKELTAYQNPKPGWVKPSPPVLNELQRVYEKQEEVMSGIMQEMADIDATLAGFTQEGDERQMVLAIQDWKKKLVGRWETLKELLEQ